MGVQAGRTTPQASGVAVGCSAGWDVQGSAAVAVGYSAGRNNQGVRAIAIGQESGMISQGPGSIAIGYAAGYSGQHATTTVINATGALLNTDRTDALFVAPIRNGAGAYTLRYNPSTKEITYS